MLNHLARSGNAAATRSLAWHWEDAGRHDEATGLWYQLALSADPDATVETAARVCDTTRGRQREEWLPSGVERRSVAARVELSILLTRTGRAQQGEEIHRAAAEKGGTLAMYNLAATLEEDGRAVEAESWLRRICDTNPGDADALRYLHDLLTKARAPTPPKRCCVTTLRLGIPRQCRP